MPLSYTRLTADGSADVFTFAIPYTSDKELTVFVNGVPASFEHLNQGTIRLTQSPKSGDTIEIHRNTPVSTLAQEYTGAGISKEALKSNAEQVLHKLQELEEGSLTLEPSTVDVKGRRLTNIAPPLEESDAVSKGWVEATRIQDQTHLLEYTKQAEAHANQAAQTLKNLETLGVTVQEFTTQTETQTLKLMMDMSEKASLLDKIIQIETQLSDKAQTYEKTLLLQKQEFLETLEEEKDALTLQEQKLQDALETLAHTALAVTTSAQETQLLPAKAGRLDNACKAD